MTDKCKRPLFLHRLKTKMRELRVTAADLAERLNLSRQAVYSMFHNDGPTVQDKTVFAVADALGVEPAYFFGSEDTQALSSFVATQADSSADDAE